MWELDIKDNVQYAFQKLEIKPKILMGAGPSNCSPRILEALSCQNLGPVAADTYEILDDLQGMLKYIFQTKNRLTLATQSAGHGGMEALITNLVDPGQKVIIAVGGIWGERMVAIAKNYGIDVVRLTCKPGGVFSFEYLEEEIVKHKPVLLFITHGESSAGTCQPLEGLGDICHRHNCLLAVDAVASFGGVPLFIDKWEIDAVVAASQKVASAPAGLAFLSFNKRAEKLMRAKKVPPPFYFNVLGLAEHWNCFGTPRKYYYTYGTCMLVAVREALAYIIEEGLVESWKRHKRCAEKLWAGLEKLGLELFVKEEKHRLYSVTSAVVPKGIKWPVLLEYIYKKYNTEIGFGLGPTANTCIRVGSMGYNAKSENVDFVLNILADGLAYCRTEEGQKGSSSRSEVME